MAKNLSIGAVGAEVAWLHEQLQRHDFDIPDSEVRSLFFGPGTCEAVRAYQREHEITCSGEVDDSTMALLADDPPPSEGGVGPSGSVPIAAEEEMTATFWVVHGVVREDGELYPDRPLVRVFDAAHVGGDGLGHATAGRDGTYRIEYEPPQPGGTTDFAVAVSAFSTDGREIGFSAPEQPAGPDMEIDLEVTDPRPPRRVRGTVVDTQGLPVPDLIVRVLDRDIGAPIDVLGVVETHSDGAFSVKYRLGKFVRDDVDPPVADIVFDLRQHDELKFDERKFRVERLPAGEDDVITAPLPVPDDELVLGIVARPDELVRITVTDIAGTPFGPSEYKRIITALLPITSRHDIVEFDEAKYRDISFAARETGAAVDLIDAMVAAHKLQVRLGESVAQQTCYGVVRHTGARTVNAVAALLVSDLIDALDTAVKVGTIDSLDEAASVVAAELHRVAVSRALEADPANASVTTPLTHAVSDSAVRASVLSILLAPQEGDVWEEIELQHPQVDIGRLQYSLQLSALVNDNDKLFTAITTKMPNITAMDALVRQLDHATLVEAIKDANAVPDDPAPGESQADMQDRLARSLRRLMDAAHPTAAVARTFAKIHETKPNMVDAPTTAFLDMLAVEGIDLATADLNAVTASKKIVRALTDGQRIAGLAGAQRAQRLFRVSGDAMDLGLLASALDVTGKPFGGAVDIARLGRPAFLARFPSATQVQVAALEQVHSRAQTLADSLADLLVAQHQDNRPDQIRSTASGLYQPPPDTALVTENQDARPDYVQLSTTEAIGDQVRLASWTKIFGSEEQCECDECRSVIGPAAYLVDLFEYLDKRCKPDKPDAMGVTLLDRLIGHPTKGEGGSPIAGIRPDLAHIELTCHNVNTTIPFIDVINQILESVIAFDGSVIPLATDGNGNIIQPPVLAPNELSPGVTGAQLSASPERIIAKAYKKLADAVCPIGLPYDRQLDTTRTWMRQSGVDRATALRIFRQPDDAIAAETLGLFRRDWEIITGNAFGGSAPDPAPPSAAVLYGVATTDALTNARQVMQALAITFERLVEVVRTNFVGGLVPDANDPDTAARILLTVEQLKKLRTANYQTTDPQILRALELGGITGDDVKAFDAAHPGSTIVLDPSISCDPDAVGLRHLDDTPLKDGEWLRIHRFVRLSTRSGIAPADLDVALTAIGAPTATDRATLRQLRDLARLRNFLGVDWPRAAAVVGGIGTRGRTNLYDELFVDSGLAQVHPLLGRGPAGVLVQGGQVELAAVAEAIASVLQWTPEVLAAVASELKLTRVTLAHVSTLHRIAILARALGIPAVETLRLHTLLRPNNSAGSTLRFLERAERIIGLRVGITAIEALAAEPKTPRSGDPAVDAAQAARITLETTLHAAGTGSEPAEARKLVVDTVAKELEIDPGSARQLVDASGDLAALSFKPSKDQLDRAQTELIRIARLAKIIRALAGAGLSLCDVLGRPSRPANVSLAVMIRSGLSATRLEVIDDMARFADLARRIGRPERLAEAASRVLGNDYAAMISAIASWLDVSDKRASAIRNLRGAAGPAPLEFLADLADMSRATKRFGIEPTQVNLVLGEPVAPNAVETLLAGVATHYSSASWLELSKQLTDPIRERSRDALVAYLKHHEVGITDDNDLFAKYLVDVGRDSFVLTSPIQQATFAVQTFVQRCLLGLYGPVMRDQVNSDEWVVQGSYPVWASRMMTFLWPEQILNPAWRDDKSPAFIELENGLRQGDVTEANARKALEGYLDSMAVTSSLEICGTYLQDRFTGADSTRFIAVLHIVGRTRTSPRRYFYRRYETHQHHKEWTDWEPITADIEGIEQDRVQGRKQDSDPPPQTPGVHVQPVVWGGALHLFWATLVRKVDIPSAPPKADIAAPKIEGRISEPYWEIKLNYTRRDPAGWTPKTQWPAVVETWTAPYTIHYYVGFGGEFYDMSYEETARPIWYEPEELLLHVKTVQDDAALVISVASRSATTQSELLFTFTTAGPHGRTTISRDWGLPGGDHPEWKGTVSSDFQAISASGDLFAVASSDRPSGDRLLTASTPMRINSPTQAFPDPMRVPLLLDLGDNVYFAQTAPGTTSIGLLHLANFEDDSHAVHPSYSDTVIDSVSRPLVGPAVIDQAKAQQLARIRKVTPPELISAAKATVAQSLKARNPWINGKALVVATADFTSPSVAINPPSTVTAVPPTDAATIATLEHERWWGGGWWSGDWGLGEWWSWWRNRTIPAVDLTVSPLSNPFVNQFQNALRTGGLDALYKPGLQHTQLDAAQTFRTRCAPDPQRVTAPDTEGVEFESTAPCGRQHWELFFHIPALLQDLQRENKQLDAALATIRRIYDPLSPVTDPKDVWRFTPFRDAQPIRIEELLAKLNQPPEDKERQDVEAQLDQMRLYPFQGHRIARLRPIAYKRWLVTEFVRLLIELTDRELRAFTPESVNRSFLYCLTAAAIMGQAPQRVRPRAAMAPRTYAELRPLLDSSSNALLAAETYVGAQPVVSSAAAPAPGAVARMARAAAIGYFGIPRNKKLHALWDLVEDRLFKLRHGMNIDGVRVQLPLFLPPIDPAVLAQAVAGGQDLNAALQMLGAERPRYRFAVAHREAVAAAQNLITIGEALLQAYTQRDAESLARLTATQQKDMAQQILDARAKQVQIAEAELADTEGQREAHLQTWRHFRDLLGLNLSEPGPSPDKSGYAAAQRQLNLVQSSSVNFASLQVIPDIVKGVAFLASPSTAAGLALIDASAGGVTMAPGMMLAEEKQELESSFEAVKLSFDAALLEILAGALGLIPNFEGAVKPLGAGAAIHFGGPALAAAARAAAGNKNTAGGMHRFLAQVYGKQASLVLRERDWILGLNQAAAHVHEIDKRIAVSKLRIELAKAEQSTQTLALQHAEQITTYLETQKFTRFELFDQRINHLRDLFRRIADIGFDLAHDAQICYRAERDPKDLTNFVTVGPAASAEAELLSGHRLMACLQEMNRSFIATSPVGPQLTKHISLREIDPVALQLLRETGTTTFKIDELWFDLDHPAHYDRRIVSVAVSIPCVTGPMAGVGGTLTLTDAWRRRTDSDDPGLLEQETPLVGVKSIALSSGRDDSGRFEIRVDDPLYHPFEGLGAVSRWDLTLPAMLRKFNYRTISDVVLSIRYTAEAGSQSRETKWIEAFKGLTQFGGTAVQLISLRHDRPDAWATYQSTGKLRLPAPVDMLPYVLRHFRGVTLKLASGEAQPIFIDKEADPGDSKHADADGSDLVVDDLGVADRKTLDDVTVRAQFTLTTGPLSP
ncbi:neuraminidase-like domain-containing protein [Nocardia noduli]|uniref:Tc toxin subunit A-related protein n=1 Tax=Nocardia noduli TaxID=2815722 RepID=UPI001C21144B|nr:neuraminidase-like domain-containing protein [Nocardia noduli]